jgi:hypothetical protein
MICWNGSSLTYHLYYVLSTSNTKHTAILRIREEKKQVKVTLSR